MARETFIITGNHGAVEVDTETGHPIAVKACENPHCTCQGVGYQNITRFDVADYQRRNGIPPFGEVDIIHIGQWETIAGESIYEPAR